MFGWFSKRSRIPSVPVEEPGELPDLPVEPVMREVPSRPTLPPGASHAPPPSSPPRIPPPRNGERAGGLDAATRPLVTWLTSADVDTRVAAARELGRRGDPAAVEPLIAALRDAQSPVRIAVANALGKLRDERAIDALVAALSDQDGGARTAARGALEAFGTARADAAIAAHDHPNAPPAAEETKAPEPAAPAAKAVEPPSPLDVTTPSGEAARIEWLIAGLRAEDVSAQSAAADGLVEAGASAVEAIVALLGDENVWVRKRAADVLGRIGEASAAQPIRAALDAISPADRSYETYHLRRSLELALTAATVSPAPASAEPPLAASPIDAAASTDDVSASATPQAEELARSAPAEPRSFIPGNSDLTDEQLGARLRVIAQAVLGGGGAQPPLDTYDGRRDAARAIGEALHARGGATLMLQVLDEHVGTHLGRHSIGQFWDGVGDWRG